jgi:hypothetical protein
MAMPFTAATVVVPESVPPPGSATILMVTLSVAVLTTDPFAARSPIWIGGEIIAPSVALPG